MRCGDTSERRSLEARYGRYCRQMLLVARRILPDPQDAEDAVHNAFLSLAQNLAAIPTGEAEERAYVLTSAKNAALSFRSRSSGGERAPRGHTARKKDAPFQQVAQCQDRDRLLLAVRKLPEPYREVLLLICVEQQTVAEAARVLQRKPGTIRQQLSRGKQRLAALCHEEGILVETK